MLLGASHRPNDIGGKPRVVIATSTRRWRQSGFSRGTWHAKTRAEPEHIAHETETNERKKRIAGALLGVTAEEPDLINPARELKARIEKSLMKRASDPVLARIVMLAIDGMSYREMLGFDPLSPADREKVRGRLLSLTEDIYS